MSLVKIRTLWSNPTCTALTPRASIYNEIYVPYHWKEIAAIPSVTTITRAFPRTAEKRLRTWVRCRAIRWITSVHAPMDDKQTAGRLSAPLLLGESEVSKGRRSKPPRRSTRQR